MMLGVGTLFSYKFAEPKQHTMRYGVITKRFDDRHIQIQWMHGGEPYPVLESDLMAMVKSGGPGSGIIYNTNERANCN